MASDVAADAVTALALLKAAAARGQGYDLALLDLCMPGQDGLSLASAVAADPALAATRCMILTSAGTLDASDAARAAVREWVTKPVRVPELHRALLRLSARGTLDTAAAATVPAQRAQGSVLIVEDNPVNQLVASGVLDQLGYTWQLAGNGREALDALAAERFDAVLMDCHMPELDGFGATRELRRREQGGPRVPVIAMTAGVLAEDRARCLAAGMDDFVGKPIDVGRLRRTLAAWIDGAAATSREPAADLPAGGTAGTVLEPARLDLLRRIGPDDGWGMLPDVVSAFLDDAEPQLAQLHAAVAAQDSAAVAAQAHRLRGSANLGAAQLAEACAALEQSTDSKAVPQLLSAVQGELAAARAELEQLLVAH